jgi:hypothetical protein
MDRKDWKNKWAAENPDAYKKYQREYRQKRRLEDPEFRERIVRHMFKDEADVGRKWVEHIPERILESFKAQKTCEICGIEFGEKVTKCLDHNHITRIARGALCRQCNSALGQLRDNIQILNNAIAYLQKHSATKE